MAAATSKKTTQAEPRNRMYIMWDPPFRVLKRIVAHPYSSLTSIFVSSRHRCYCTRVLRSLSASAVSDAPRRTSRAYLHTYCGAFVDRETKREGFRIISANVSPSD
jgi:hypothetical protein